MTDLSKLPTPQRRISNLRAIVADDTVNNFARAVCGEAASHIEQLEHDLAAARGAALEEVPCRHEWYQGACAHCSMDATEFRALKNAAQAAQNAAGQAQNIEVSPIEGCSGRDPRASSDDTSSPAPAAQKPSEPK